jgi:hypothetical protein
MGLWKLLSADAASMSIFLMKFFNVLKSDHFETRTRIFLLQLILKSDIINKDNKKGQIYIKN